MSHERAIRLLNEELDGELDSGARAELEARLAADPALAAERAALAALDHTLRTVADAEMPPPGLAQRIARRIELAPRPTLVERIAAAWRRPLWVPAAAFATGLAVAVALYPALESSLEGSDAAHMTGTLISEPTRAGLMPHARLALALEDLQGQVTLADAAIGSALLEFDLAAHGVLDIAVDLGDSGLDYAPLPAASGVQVLQRDGGRIRLRRQDPGYFALPLQGDGSPGGTLKVEFSIDGKLLSAGVLAAR